MKSTAKTVPEQILKREKQSVPYWLSSYEEQDSFPAKEFFSSRVVYYPGSADDGHPLRTFGKSHAAHCFVFADYGLPASFFEDQLSNQDHKGHPKGYRPLTVQRLKEKQLKPGGWIPHINLEHIRNPFTRTRPPGGPFAIWAVLDRTESFGDDHGPSRIAILVVGGDGIATFDALFCQPGSKPPFAVLVQDHGFGGNYTHFGGSKSPLWQLANKTSVPKWLLLADGTDPWPDYEIVSSVDCGGMHANPRRLLLHRDFLH